MTVTVRVDPGIRHTTVAWHSTPVTPARYRSLGTKHGYTLTLPKLRRGSHRVCTWLTDAGGHAPKTSLGCVTVRTR